MAINFLNSVDFNKNELLNPTIENQPNDAGAGTGVAGQLYFNTTDGILKVWDGSWTEVGGGVTSLTTTDGTYIDLTPNSATTGAVTVTADLSAVDGTAAAGERYLTKTNKWATIASIPGTYTFDVSDGTNSETINSGDTVTWSGTGTTTVSYSTGSNTFTINSADQYTGTVTSVGTQNSTFISGSGGPITGSGSLTYSLSATGTPSSSTYLRGDNTWAAVPANTNDFLTSLSFNTGSGVLTATVQNQSNVTVDLDGRYLELDGGTMTGDINMDTNQITNLPDPTNAQDAATKAYVDAATIGGLIYQGGYNAATNTPNLDNNPSPNPIKKGWTYTVTADGSFFTEQVRVGDVLIAEQDAPTALADWTTVQNNIDLASLTQVGIGNVNASTDSDKTGLSVSYSSGTANIGLDVDSLTQSTPTTNADAFLPYYDDAASENKKITFAQLSTEINTGTSFAATISATGTITHSLNTRDVVIQLYDTVTYETVYADVDRISTTQATITFAATPANSIRVLVQKIG